MGNKWYGWIPLLTKEIFFEYSIEYFINSNHYNFRPREITDENEKNSIENVILSMGGESGYKYYEFFKKLGDPPLEEESTIVISIDKEYKITDVFIFDDKRELERWVKCKIENNGLVEMNVGYQRIEGSEDSVITDAYIIIRDIYHQHTHHKHGEKDADILLSPVLAEDDKEAIKKINEKFQKKIIARHRRIITWSKKGKDLSTSSEIITKAKGELTYAISFVELFKNNLPHHDQYYFTYLNAIRSIEILEKDIEMHYISETDERTSEINRGILRLTDILTFFTICIGVITVVIAIDASFGIVETLFHEKLFVGMKVSGIWLWMSLLALWAIVIIVIYFLIRRLHFVGEYLKRIRKK